jgi:dTMP kinase
LVTREPGGTPLGEAVRALLLDARSRISARAEVLLYEASRAQHVAEKIGPALDKGRLVLSDRFSLSTLAYQALGRGLGLAEVMSLDRYATGGISPDLTLVLDLPVHDSLRRIGARPDRMERRSLLEKARQAYRRLARKDRAVVLVDGRGSEEAVEDRIRKVLEAHRDFSKFLQSAGRHSREGGNPGPLNL